MLKLLITLATLALAAPANAWVLTWTETSTNETGFEVERAADAQATFAPIGKVGANVLTFDDTAGVTNNCYRVRAFNGFGVSPYSNVACATGPDGTVTLTIK